MEDIARMLLIINPISGTKSKKGLDKSLVRELGKYGFDVSTAFTEAPGHAVQLAGQAAREGFQAVLACGGDGTINETARGLIDTPMPLGIIPAGSGNGLARHIGIPVDPIQAVRQVIARRNVISCDYALANGHPFFCTFGVGFDAAVSDRFAAAPSRGKATYIRSALHEFIHYRPRTYTITADGQVLSRQALLIAVCNASQYGNNAYIAPDASITDGLLDLVIVEKMPRIAMPLMSVEMMAGTLTARKGLIKRRVSSVTISRQENGPAHLDGEPFPEAGNEIDITVRPASLKIFTNPDKPIFRPLITPFASAFADLSLSVGRLFRHNGP